LFLALESNGLSLAHIQQPQLDESTLVAMQQHMAQQAAFSQIPDVVKTVRDLRIGSFNLNMSDR